MRTWNGLPRLLLAAATLAATVAASGGGALAAEPQPAPQAAVTIDNFSFTPQTLTVKAGTTVTWTNRDDMPHTVVSTVKAFASEALDTDQTFTHTFDQAGTYDYFCSIHPRMTGRVVVLAK